MLKTLLASSAALALLALAACDGGSAPPQSEADQTGSIETAPAEPSGGSGDTVE